MIKKAAFGWASLLLALLTLTVTSGYPPLAKAPISANAKGRKLTNQEAVTALVKLYAEMEAFPITVSTQKGDRSPYILDAPFQGKEIPPALLTVFDSLVLYNPEEAHTQVYATGRFAVGATTIGLLTRVPGVYWSSRIELFLLDTKKGKVVDCYQVAETWGCAGESLLIESRIEKVSPAQFLIKTRKGQSWPTDDSLEKYKEVDSLLTSRVTSQQIQLIDKKRVNRRYTEMKVVFG